VTDPPPVDVAAIADLTGWARRLTEQGSAASAPERAAYHTAKTALLARLAAGHPDTDPTDRPDRTLQ
jgi:hypothetical protein